MRKADYTSFWAAKDVARALTPAEALRYFARLGDEILAPLRKMCVVRGNPANVVELAQRVDSCCTNLMNIVSQDADLSHESSQRPRM